MLGMKKRGFGAGRWNGFGGKFHFSTNSRKSLDKLDDLIIIKLV